MSDRLQTTLRHLEAAGQGERFVLAGSLGRAALLGDEDFPLFDASNEVRDVDVIDSRGSMSERYIFSDAATIDSLLTQRIRPIDQAGGEWGLYDPKASNASVDPEITIPSDLLGIHQIELPFARGIRLLTFDACGHTVLTKVCSNTLGTYRKHSEQISQLEQHSHDSSCRCVELESLVHDYHAELKSKNPPTLRERMYFKARGIARSQAPVLFAQLQQTKIGELVREARGTQTLGADSIHDYLELAA